MIIIPNVGLITLSPDCSELMINCWIVIRFYTYGQFKIYHKTRQYEGKTVWPTILQKIPSIQWNMYMCTGKCAKFHHHGIDSLP